MDIIIKQLNRLRKKCITTHDSAEKHQPKQRIIYTIPYDKQTTYNLEKLLKKHDIQLVSMNKNKSKDPLSNTKANKKNLTKWEYTKQHATIAVHSTLGRLKENERATRNKHPEQSDVAKHMIDNGHLLKNIATLIRKVSDNRKLDAQESLEIHKQNTEPMNDDMGSLQSNHFQLIKKLKSLFTKSADKIDTQKICITQITFTKLTMYRGHQMMPVLYYLPPSPPCRSVLLLGKMLDIEFDLRAINVMEGEHLKPDFVQINPQHCIPTLDDHDLVLWESRVILTYLTSAYAKDDSLYPSDIRTRALVDQRLQFDLSTLYQRTVDYFFPTLMMGAPLDESKKAKLGEALMWFDTILKGRTWSAASTFTLADLALCVTVSQIEAFDFDMHPYPRVNAWFLKCKEELEPFGYDEINQSGADTLAGVFRSKLI